MLGRESCSQGQSTTLTEPANNNPIRGDTTADFLCDDLIYLIPGLEDPRFVLWTFEIKAEDIKPIARFESQRCGMIAATYHPGISIPPLAVHGTVGLLRVR